MRNDEAVLQQFGRLIVQKVPDEIITATDQALSGHRQDIYSKYLHTQMLELPTIYMPYIERLIPYLVDGTISVFLQQFDIHYEWLQIHMRQNDGTFANLAEKTDGLEGKYNGYWVSEYTQQRADRISQEADELFDAGFA